MNNLKTDYQVIIDAAGGVLAKGVICFIAFYVWHFTLGFIFPEWIGNTVGVISAIAVLLLMLFFKGANLPFQNLEDTDADRLKKDIICGVTHKCSKKLLKAYNECNLTKAIDNEFIDPVTGDKYRLIFRRMRNGERMQASHVRRTLQAPEETKEDLFAETEIADHFHPEGYQTKESLQDKTTGEEAARPDETIYTQGGGFFTG